MVGGQRLFRRICPEGYQGQQGRADHRPTVFPTEKEASVEHVTMGKITGDQIELDRGKGKNSWIKLSMQKADDGQLWLKGRYSATAGKKGSKKVVQGSISIKKAN
ncbi:MAG: hypothetical protein QF384_14595 [Alphaproteobacteria bacterium]|jgi:hypothetical protein|nr:hypothetical protein [Alphaproteobacteria bacterium]MDP6830492.1 hypothetical protein [Alphaproteobacteria bacterium]